MQIKAAGQKGQGACAKKNFPPRQVHHNPSLSFNILPAI
jgi:hypothetical protein